MTALRSSEPPEDRSGDGLRAREDAAVPARRLPTLLIVDDHLLLAESLASALAASGEFDVVGVVGSLAAARARLGEEPAPDLVLVDLRLPDGRGTDLVADVERLGTHTYVVLMTGVPEPGLLESALAAGCRGVVLKEERADVLVGVLLAVARNELSSGPRLLSDLVYSMAGGGRPPAIALTARERQVLQLLVEGLRTRVIAQRLGVAEATARNHVQAVLRRLGAGSRGEAVAIALRERLVLPPSDAPPDQPPTMRS